MALYVVYEESFAQGADYILNSERVFFNNVWTKLYQITCRQDANFCDKLKMCLAPFASGQVCICHMALSVK